MGRVSEKQLSKKDISPDVTDIQVRISNLRKQEERLRGLVDQAQSLDEVLSLEKELARVREDIEVLQGRLNTLNEGAVLSTIRLEILEASDSGNEPPRGAFYRAMDSVRNSPAGWIVSLVLVLSGIGGTVYYFRLKVKTP